jgi:hypothetical protein
VRVSWAPECRDDATPPATASRRSADETVRKPDQALYLHGWRGTALSWSFTSQHLVPFRGASKPPVNPACPRSSTAATNVGAGCGPAIFHWITFDLNHLAYRRT